MLSIQFDGTALSEDAIMKLTYQAKLFNDTFKLGATLCREFHLWVDKSAVSTHPLLVQIYSNGTLFATLHVDSIDDSNDYYYDYTLLDSMVYLNQVFKWSGKDGKQVYQLVEEICANYGITAPPRNYTARTMVVSWEEYCTAREFISWVAEINGGYAYINPANRLIFAPFVNNNVATFVPNDIADLYVGDKHIIKKVVYDNLAHYEYDSEGIPTGDTLYLNPDNILFTDSGGFTIQGLVNNVGSVICGFEFYNMKSSYIYLPNLPNIFRVGDRIQVNGYPTILEADYSYNQEWSGGINIDLKTGTQEETNVVDSDLERAVNKIDITLDRQNGIIDLMGQRVEDVEDGLEEQNIHFQVDAAKSEVRVTNENTFTPKTYTAFQGDGMRIYVDDVQVAEATANRFECDKGLGVQDWAIEHGDDAAVLMIYRRR